MNYPWLDEYCLGKRGATKDYKEEWQATRYMIGGKMFALHGHENTGRLVITLKLSPADGDFLRTQYADIIPGYYMNKVHWNSVYLDGSVPDDIVREMIDKSYSILFASLTKKAQKEITGSSSSRCSEARIYMKGAKDNMSASYRKATLTDMDVLIQLRLDFLSDFLAEHETRHLNNREYRAIVDQLRDYLPRQMGHAFAAYIAELEEQAVASVFIAIAEKPAGIGFPTGKTATVLNVFTYPPYRRQGMARHLLRMMIDDAKTMGISYLDLTATNSGKSLYEQLGFLCSEKPDLTEMKLRFIE